MPDAPDLVLHLCLPRVTSIVSYDLPDEIPISIPSIIEGDQELILNIPLKKYFKAGKEYEIKVRVDINSFSFDQYLITEAKLLDASGQILELESVQVAVFSKGKFLQFLPGNI